MSQTVFVGVPDAVNLEVQSAVDASVVLQLFAGKPILASKAGTANVIVLTVTAHGRTNGDTVIVNGHDLNVNANGTWVVTVIDANNYSLNGSTFQTNGGPTGKAGVPRDLTGYTVKAQARLSAQAAGTIVAVAASVVSPATAGQVTLTFAAADTKTLTPNVAGVYDLFGYKASADERFARGAIKFVPFVTQQ